MRRFPLSPFTRLCAVLLLLAGPASIQPAAAADLDLGMPIACVPGQNCWIMHYADNDKSKGKGFRDYRCGSMTYDTHKGTDFAIENLAAMTRGVPVLATAAGTVRVTRDGMDDVDVRTIGLDAVRGKACGNAAIINHAGGWSTQYCHMRKGSLRVKKGDTVRAGQPLGLVGMSSETEYPHLHFVTRFKKAVVDPFVGLSRNSNCGATVKPLWQQSVRAVLSYSRGIPYIAGVTSVNPSSKAARAGTLTTPKMISSQAGKIYVWADFIGVEAGDRVEVRMKPPTGKPVIFGRIMPSTRSRQFFEAGLGRPSSGWARGTYKFEILLLPRGLDAAWRNQTSRTVTVR